MTATKEELEKLALNRAKALTIKLVSFRNRNINVLTMKMIRKELDEAANAFLKVDTFSETLSKVEESIYFSDKKTTSSGKD